MLTAGMVAWGAKKLSQPDVQKIEQSTGKSYEDLSDAEVQQAVTTLGIEAQPLTPEEQAQVQGQPEFEEVEVEDRIPTADFDRRCSHGSPSGSPREVGASHWSGAALPAHRPAGRPPYRGRASAGGRLFEQAPPATMPQVNGVQLQGSAVLGLGFRGFGARSTGRVRPPGRSIRGCLRPPDDLRISDSCLGSGQGLRSGDTKPQHTLETLARNTI